MNPQDYSVRTVYRPPAAWYQRVNNRLGVLLTSLGLAPRDAVMLKVRGRSSGKRRGPPSSGPPTGATTIWWRWLASRSGSATSRRPRGTR